MSTRKMTRTSTMTTRTWRRTRSMHFLGVLWGALGSFGAPLGTLWEPFGVVWGVFGDPWGSLGDPLGVLRGPWGALGGSVGCRFASWSLLGRFLGPFWDHVGSILGSFSKRKSAFVFGSLLEPFWEQLFLSFGELFGSFIGLGKKGATSRKCCTCRSNQWSDACRNKQKSIPKCRKNTT